MLTSSSYDIKTALSPIYENVADKVLLLKDGYQIFESDYKKLMFNLFSMAIKHEKSFMELVTKCFVPEYTISQGTQELLKLYQLMNPGNEKYLNSDLLKKEVLYVIYDLLDKYGFKNIQAIKFLLTTWLDFEIEYLVTFSNIVKKMIFSVVPSVDNLVSTQKEKMILEDIKIAEHDFKRSAIPSHPSSVAKLSDNGTINAKIMGFLASHKYELLFIAVVAGYGLYDHYHENRLGNAVASIKDNLFIMWQKASNTPEKDKRLEEKSDYQLDGFPGLSF